MFSSIDKFQYDTNINRSIYYQSGNEMKIRRMENTEDCSYTLSIESTYAKLIFNKRVCDKFGTIRFTENEAEMKLNFVKIDSLRNVSYFFTRLVMFVQGPNVQFKERSQTFTVITKLKIFPTIAERQNKTTWSLSGDDIREQLSRMGSRFVAESEECSSSNKCILQIMDKQIITPIAETNGVVKTHLWFFNFIDFDCPDSLKRRAQSMKNVCEIFKTFKGIRNCNMKGVANATKDDFFADLGEYLAEIRGSNEQVMILIMSHGKDGGFYTREGSLVTEDEFHRCIDSIDRNHVIRKVIVHSHCRETTPVAQSRPFWSTLSSSDSSDEGEESGQVSLISDATSGTEAVANCGGPCPRQNTFITYACSPGELSIVSCDGSIYIQNLLEELIDDLTNDETVDVVEVIERVNKYFKNTPIIKDGKRVRQVPCSKGSLECQFRISKEVELRQEDEEESVEDGAKCATVHPLSHDFISANDFIDGGPN